MTADETPRYSYQQLADDLRARISRGQLRPGVKLPSIRGLAEQYGIAPQTAKSALAVLHDEGLVQPDSTRGYFVTDDAGDRARRLQSATRDYATLVSQVDRLTVQVSALTERLTALEQSRPRQRPR